MIEDPHRSDPTGPAGALYRLTLPYTEPPPALRANYRGRHWGPRNTASRNARVAVATLGRAAGLHRLTGVRHVTACLRWAPGDRIRRDAPNLAPFSKALIDGLTPDRTVVRRVKGKLSITRHVGCGLVPDDADEFVTALTPEIIPPPARGMWLYLWVQR